ncbi:hypothetical protein JNL27_03500, partial [bacterium]|nr:hypothetical protein [bacterium]
MSFVAGTVWADQDSSGTYRWTNSLSPSPKVVYNWIDATDGTALQLADDATSGFVNIGLDFHFYDTTVSRLMISSNGFISFDSLTASYPTHVTIPSAGAPDRIIAGYWTDLIPQGTLSRIYYKTTGTAPNRKFIVTWSNYDQAGGASESITFQIVLFETSNQVLIQYQALLGSNVDGSSCTVGIEDSAGVSGLLYCFNNAGALNNNLAILFHTNHPSTADASISPASVVTHTNLQQFIYTIRTTSPADSMARFDSLLVFNPFTDKSITVTDISVDGVSQFIQNSSTRPADYGFAVWNYNSSTDSLAVQTAYMAVKDSVKITFLLDVRDTLGAFLFPSNIRASLVSANRILTGGTQQVSVISDSVAYIKIKWSTQSFANEAGDTTLTADDSVKAYAYGFDKNDNFIRRVKVNWRVNGSNGFLTADSLNNDSITFHAGMVGTSFISADTSGFTDQTGLISVSVGVRDTLVLRNAPGGAGSNYSTPFTMQSDSLLKLYLAGYDRDRNYIKDVRANWSLTGTLNGVISPVQADSGVVFTPGLLSVGKIHSDGGFMADSTNTITVVAGAAAQVLVETQRSGSGVVLPELYTTSDSSITVYAVLRDADGNFAGLQTSSWSVSGGIGTLNTSSSDSVILTLTTLGSGQLTASGTFTSSGGIVHVLPGALASV